MTQKVTVSPYVNLTSRMVGENADWQWEITSVSVNGVSESFTWVDGVLNIPGYTSGVVLADFPLYLIYDEPAGYYPKDPTDPLSDLVFWESRLGAFFNVGSSIKSFDTGLTEITPGSISIRIDDDWIDLVSQLVLFNNRTIRVYTDDVLVFKGVTTQQSQDGYVYTLNVQKRQTILESECTWGDPAYLNRINRSSNTAFYNGANIPVDFENYAIPMLFGAQTPYELDDAGEIDLGTPAPTFLVPPGTKRASQGLSTSSVCVRVIPTGAGTGIIGRMPNYQTIGSTPINEALTGPQHAYGRSETGNNTVILTKMIKGEVCTLQRTSGPDPILNSARLYTKTSSQGRFNLANDDVVFTNYEVIKDCDEKIHYFPTSIPQSTWLPGAVLSGTFTPGGHRWLTVSGLLGLDLRTDDLYMVITEITGQKTAVEVMQFALESHGFTVDSASFAAVAADLPYDSIQQAGFGTQVPTLSNFIAEINRSLLTVLVFPTSNDEPFILKIDPTRAADYTLDDTQITLPKITSEFRDQARIVRMRPKYARNDEQKTDLFYSTVTPMAELFGSQRDLDIDHVLDELPSTRFVEIADFHGSPLTQATFDVNDDSVAMEIADCVQIDHPAFQQKILITSINRKPQGRAVTGRFLYVNDN